MAGGFETGPGDNPRRTGSKLWLGRLLLLAGLVLLAIGLLNVSRLLGTPLEAQRGYLAQTVFSLVVGLWLLILGIYTLQR